ncbi:hypothetical protein [Nostoc sp.]|uniref:hypothetical protein n=1 Tax=Nostoc sp. TaxID=1180 RepID=UPI002FF6D905
MTYFEYLGDEGDELIINAQCPMPNAPCPMPNAQCPMPNDKLKNEDKSWMLN